MSRGDIEDDWSVVTYSSACCWMIMWWTGV